MDKSIYDVVKEVLEKYPQTRGDDKKLIWVVFGMLGFVDDKKITRENFLEAPSCESVTRARRKVQENFPDLNPNEFVLRARKTIEEKRGFHVYHEKVEPKKVDRQAVINDITSL